MTDELPRFGAGDRGLFRYDKERRELIAIEQPQKITVNAPMVHIDSIEPTESMATHDRTFFTSKKKLRQHYREHGFIETGGESAPPERVDPEKRKREIMEDAARALNDLRWGNVPLSEQEKEQCHRERMELERYKERNR